MDIQFAETGALAVLSKTSQHDASISIGSTASQHGASIVIISRNVRGEIELVAPYEHMSYVTLSV